MKALHYFLSAFVLALMLPIFAFANTFSDLENSHGNFVAIEYLVSIGTLEGYDDGTFKPAKTVNRAELMKILVSGQGIEPDEETYKECFPDVVDQWFARYVCYASEQGWVDGYPDGTFQPGRMVNKVEALKMLVNALGLESMLPGEVSDALFDDTDSSSWYAPYVYLARELNLLEVLDGNYEPSGEMNRGGVSEYIFRTLVVQQREISRFANVERDAFLEANELNSLIPEGLAVISYVFYNGEVYRVESDEYVEVRNDGQGTLQLEGYTISGSRSEEVYTFPELALEPGETVKVYTNQGDYSFESEDALWNNGGETVYLKNSEGVEVDVYTYTG